MLVTNRLSGFTPIGLPQNADNLFSTMRFAFHQCPPYGLTKTHAKTGSTIEGHATVLEVMEIAKRLGIDKVVLATEKEEGT